MSRHGIASRHVILRRLAYSFTYLREERSRARQIVRLELVGRSHAKNLNSLRVGRSFRQWHATSLFKKENEGKVDRYSYAWVPPVTSQKMHERGTYSREAARQLAAAAAEEVLVQQKQLYTLPIKVLYLVPWHLARSVTRMPLLMLQLMHTNLE